MGRLNARATFSSKTREIHGLGTAHFEYQDRHFQIRAIKLLPGEYFASDEDVMMVTLLGSCVAACIRDPERQIGGMNHFLLPHSKVQDKGAAARYGSYAMEVLINDLLKLGARRQSLVAKVFGGANVVRCMTSSKVGEDNAQFVIDYLQREKIKVLAADLGGNQARRVHYFPNTGQAMVRLLPVTEGIAVERAEKTLEDKAETQTGKGGDVELFS